MQDQTKPLSQMALSILINICDRNQSAVLHLIHLVEMVKFRQILKSYGMLGAKMFLQLAKHLHNTNPNDYHYFFMHTFAELDTIIR